MRAVCGHSKLNSFVKSVEVKNENPMPAGDRLDTLTPEAEYLEKANAVQISGLRVYVCGRGSNPVITDSVFYSRRGDGPYYRWSYEQKLGQWHSARMHTADVSPREFYLARWKGVPPALQLSLGEHYLE